MKRIQFQGPVKIVDVSGEPVPVSNSDTSQAEWSFKSYARHLLAQPTFVAGLDQIDAMDLVLTMKRQLDALGDEAGHLDVEDAHHKRLLDAAKVLPLPSGWGFCLLPHAVAIRDAKAPKPTTAPTPAEPAEETPAP